MFNAIPDFGDVVCSRDENGIHTNVPRRIIRHSPDGFEWGYCGSGPADFAFNILSAYIGEQEAKCGGLYQTFKEAFVAKLPKEGGTIRRDDVMRWIEEVNEYRREHGTFSDDELDTEPETDRAKIERQDFVDNSIFDMLEELNPSRHELEWDIKPISEIREVIIKYFVDELKICTEDEFYP